jgi:hypothetical protein
MLLPQAALRALALALPHSIIGSPLRVYQLEAQIGADQAMAAVEFADTLLGSGKLELSWRSIVACLAWVAARLLGGRKLERAWGPRALAEFQSSLRRNEVGWSFLSLRRRLVRASRQPGVDAAAELLETLEGGWNAETADKLAKLV